MQEFLSWSNSMPMCSLRFPRLGLNHLPDFTLSVAAGNHPRVGTGATGPQRQIRAF